MGLESMPTCSPQGPVGRSRSMGSPDGWPAALPPVKSARSSLQQIRPSQSFRETPTFLRQENDEFLLLSFAADDGAVEEGITMVPQPRETEPDIGHRDLGHKGIEETQRPPDNVKAKKKKKKVQPVSCREKAAAGRCRRSHAVPPRNSESPRKPCSRGRDPTKKATCKETHDRTRAVKRGEKKTRSDCSKTMAEAECSSQNSSPVSVLDRQPDLDGDCLTDTSTPISDAEEEGKPMPAYSRQKLSSELDCFNDPSPFLHLILTQETEGFISIEDGVRVLARGAVIPVLHSSSNLWADARRLAEREVQASSWGRRQPWKREEEVEEMVAEFGLEVLDSLLHETVGEFCHG